MEATCVPCDEHADTISSTSPPSYTFTDTFSLSCEVEPLRRDLRYSMSHFKGMQPLILWVNQIFLGSFAALTSCVRCATSPVSLKGLSLTPSSSLPHSEVSMRTSQESSFRVMTTSYTGPGRGGNLRDVGKVKVY